MKTRPQLAGFLKQSPELTKINLAGYLTQPPKLEKKEDGTSIGKMTISCLGSWEENKPTQPRKGEERTIITWNKLAENCFKTLRQYSQVTITGWEDEKETIAEEIYWIHAERIEQ